MSPAMIFVVPTVMAVVLAIASGAAYRHQTPLSALVDGRLGRQHGVLPRGHVAGARRPEPG